MKRLVVFFAMAIGLSAGADTFYVSPNGTSVVPYDSWATAATNLQDAVDATVSNDTVLVTNGTYLLASEIIVTNAITLESVNGRDVTFIDGQDTVRCFNLGDAACTLSGFTIQNGNAGSGYGGGISCSDVMSTITNCTLSGNSGVYGGGSQLGTFDHCTLSTNSATEGGGGINGGILNYCTLTGNSAHGRLEGGGGSRYSTLTHCTLTGNSAAGEYGRGGGCRYSTLTDCTLSGNSAFEGGGSYYGTLSDCTFSNNSASYGGGGAFGTFSHCTFSGNYADPEGGGCRAGALNNCMFSGNRARKYGGASSYGTLNNCILSSNTGEWYGGGSYKGTLNNCTLTGNSAGFGGGGSYQSTLNNCIIWNNTKDGSHNNWAEGTFSYCCTTPLPEGTGNITNNPQFIDAPAGNLRLNAGSACNNAGDNALAPAGTDFDGNPRVVSGIVDMGAFEHLTPVVIDITNETGTVTRETDMILLGGTSESLVGTMTWTNASNAASGTLAALTDWQVSDLPLIMGDNIITVTGTNSAGDAASDTVTITRTLQHGGNSPVHYVSSSGTAIWPYSNWGTAATNIQDAADAAVGGDTVVVTNGTYLLSEHILVQAAITLESVNGRDVTFVDGQDTVRCFDLGSVACTLSGFTIQNGHAGSGFGGGTYCSDTTPVITNCTITGNYANTGGGSYYGTLHNCTLSGNSGGWGGGSSECTLNHCTLTGNVGVYGGGIYHGSLNDCMLSTNRATGDGGGSYDCTLTRCTLTGNSAATYGGGSSHGTLNNCTLTGNSSGNDGGGCYASTLKNCTVTGNNGGRHGGGSYSGNRYNCIIWGNTTTASGDNWLSGSIYYSCTTPLPGTGNVTNNPRFMNASAGNVRLAAGSPCIDTGNNYYPPAGGDLDGNPRILNDIVDMGAYEYDSSTTDSDGDAFTDYEEYIADTSATDSNDWFRITAYDGSAVSFDSSDARQYTLLWCTNLVEGIWANSPAQTDIMGNGGLDTLTDPDPTNSPCYYRIQVEIP